jgi:hypothetical protein
VSAPRTKFLDYDAQRTPKTPFSCVMCQRDLDPQDRKVHWVHLVDDVLVLHPADESHYTPDVQDRGMFPIGPDCAKKLGVEWTRASSEVAARP